jgi:hypothetical protein
MDDSTDNFSVADILGPWIQDDWDSGLVNRCREVWDKPIRNLSREELGLLLRQRIAVEHVLPIAKKRVRDGSNDDTEWYDGQLEDAIDHAEKAR